MCYKGRVKVSVIKMIEQERWCNNCFVCYLWYMELYYMWGWSKHI
jgi:hypothetical protein